MDDLAVPDGIVLIPRAGGYSPAELIEQNKLVNRQRAVEHEKSKVQNLTFKTGVQQVSNTLQGIMQDWNNGTDRSLRRLFMTDNRLQGVGLLMVSLALGGLLIDAVV